MALCSSSMEPLTAVTILLVSLTLSDDLMEERPLEVAERYELTERISEMSSA